MWMDNHQFAFKNELILKIQIKRVINITIYLFKSNIRNVWLVHNIKKIDVTKLFILTLQTYKALIKTTYIVKLKSNRFNFIKNKRYFFNVNIIKKISHTYLLFQNINRIYFT